MIYNKKIKQLKLVASTTFLFAFTFIALFQGRWFRRASNESTCWVFRAVSTPMPSVLIVSSAIFDRGFSPPFYFLCQKLSYQLFKILARGAKLMFFRWIKIC